MQAQATKKYIRISRRKIARLARLCSRKRLAEVKPRLAFLPQKSARMLLSTIQSAEANFLFQEPNANTDNLTIKQLEVNAARGFKRLLYRARGRADRMHKRASHIHVVVTDEALPLGKAKKSSKDKGKNKATRKNSSAKTAQGGQQTKTPAPAANKAAVATKTNG